MNIEKVKQKIVEFRPYLEFLALFVIMIVSGFLLNSEDPFLSKFRPSPYFIIILLIAMKYGSPLGLAAGIFCAVFELLSFAGFSYGILRDQLYFSPQILISPLVYIGVGHFVGEAVHSSIKRNDYSRKLAAERKNLADQLAGEKTALENRYRQLESKIASESKSNYSLMRSFEKFDMLEPQFIADYTIEVCTKFSRAEKVEYWRECKGNWEKIAPVESKNTYPPAMVIKAIENEVVATSREYPLAAQNNGGDLALYMKDSNGEKHAIVCFDIPFVEWGLQLGDVLKIILREAVNSFNIWNLKFALGETAPIEKRLRVENYAVFTHQVRRQLLTLSRSQKISSVIFVKIHNELARDIKILGIVASALNSLLRISDGISYQHETKIFMLFLPETPFAGAEIVIKKISAALEKLKIEKNGLGIELIPEYVELKSAHDFEEALSTFNKVG